METFEEEVKEGNEYKLTQEGSEGFNSVYIGQECQKPLLRFELKADHWAIDDYFENSNLVELKAKQECPNQKVDFTGACENQNYWTFHNSKRV